MTRTQLKGMIRFHRRAERAYKQAGQIANAQQARAKREELIKQLLERRKP